MATDLMNIAEEIRKELQQSSTSWIRTGALLDQARKAKGEDDRAFGQWCDKQGFTVGRAQLFRYRASWKEWSTVSHETQEKINDLYAWRCIASLNHLQKARVLERLAQADGKVTRKDVLQWIDETRTQPKPLQAVKLSEVDLKKALKRAEAREAMAEKTQHYFESCMNELHEFMQSKDYKQIRSALHPDREVAIERKNEAFSALQNFEKLFAKTYKLLHNNAA